MKISDEKASLLVDFLNQCLVVDPRVRKSARELLMHDWLKINSENEEIEEVDTGTNYCESDEIEKFIRKFELNNSCIETCGSVDNRYLASNNSDCNNVIYYNNEFGSNSYLDSPYDSGAYLDRVNPRQNYYAPSPSFSSISNSSCFNNIPISSSFPFHFSLESPSLVASPENSSFLQSYPLTQNSSSLTLSSSTPNVLLLAHPSQNNIKNNNSSPSIPLFSPPPPSSSNYHSYDMSSINTPVQTGDSKNILSSPSIHSNLSFSDNSRDSSCFSSGIISKQVVSNQMECLSSSGIYSSPSFFTGSHTPTLPISPSFSSFPHSSAPISPYSPYLRDNNIINSQLLSLSSFINSFPPSSYSENPLFPIIPYCNYCDHISHITDMGEYKISSFFPDSSSSISSKNNFSSNISKIPENYPPIYTIPQFKPHFMHVREIDLSSLTINRWSEKVFISAFFFFFYLYIFYIYVYIYDSFLH
jgi:hypothetical protein